VQIELLTIGDELLLGFTIDTNGAYIARALAALGVAVVRRGTVGDGADEIATAVREALDRTGAVITTGGLGPTADDRTRDVIAGVFGRKLHRDDAIFAQVEARFRKLGVPMPPSNVNQAMIPEGARVLTNRHGTAPGLWLEDERGRWCAMLPGIPREMRGMLKEELLPILAGMVGADPTVVLSRTVRTTGIGESALAEMLGDLAKGVDGLPLAFLPAWPGVDLRLTSAERRAPSAEACLTAAAAKLRAAAPRYVYGEDDTDLAGVVLDLCREQKMRIVTAESATGGLIGARLTAIPGSSDVFLGGTIAYTNFVKNRELGVSAELLRDRGAVNEEVARAMVEGACGRFGAEVGMSITGVAGPDGGTPETPVGTIWLAARVAGETRAAGKVFVGDREEIRLRASQAALDMVRRMLTRQIT
jgi:nicotinamide-nucleotide amidase